MEFVDTHCHIHEASKNTDGDGLVQDKWAEAGITDPSKLIADAKSAGVSKLICVGCSLKDSEMAIALAQKHENCFATIGVHPHEAKDHIHSPDKLQNFCNLLVEDKIVAIGEIGLDYFYTHSSKEDQIKTLHFQLDLAVEHNLPVIFHVRDAFEDFWPIFDSYKNLRGVIHSFGATKKELDYILERNLYVGLNGIMTFTKDQEQLEAAKSIPLSRLLLETDAPFLTPVPFRGKICQPSYVKVTAEFLAKLRGETLEAVAKETTRNAKELFKF